MPNGKLLLFVALIFVPSTRISAQSSEEVSKEIAIIEIGAAAAHSFTEGNSSFGPTVAVEVTPIENWLEIEAGVTPLFRRHSTEWTNRPPFQKPWTLSSKVEFYGRCRTGMDSTRTPTASRPTQSASKQAADFMFWPSKRRDAGSAGILNQVTTTNSVQRTSIRSVSAAAY